ncbi:MAG TPA: DUF1501 domain-containing protein [Pirellulaceae bacterium]|nr:DUF1501 domain-containing protein [Planctomycetales bacterium]MCB9940320.1 DUF1501 domain-containing protein [Planctomycetaceae bacterium]HRX78082.1 DUF1501 domain-containing protein [Pirellulaceae bacterium]
MNTRYCDGVKRRDFLRAGAIGSLGLTLPSFLRLAQANEGRKSSADAVLFINLEGGPSHLDTLDMKPEGPSETRGEFKPIQSAIPGLNVCEYMPKFAAVADKFSLLRGISHSAGSHPLGQSYISTGNRPTPALIYPSLGAVATKELPGKSDMPSYIAIPKTEWNAGFMGDAYAPFKTNAVPRPGEPFVVRGISLAEGLTVDRVNRREQLLKKVDRTFREADTNSQLLEALDKFGGQAYSMITSPRAQKAFDVTLEPEPIRERFSADEFNQSLLLACRLIEFGVPFITVSNAGWDTHTDNFAGHKRLIPPLDVGLSSVIATLAEKGLLERTLVVAMGEFGRTPKINVNTGRDHYPRASWSLFAGGGVQPGQLVGGTDAGGEAPDDDTDITPDDIAATIYHALAIDPLTEYHTNTGRPVMLVPHGRVITRLFA